MEMPRENSRAVAAAKLQVAEEAERRRHDDYIYNATAKRQVNYGSAEEAHRQAERGLRWLKKHPGATIKDAPAHIVEKLRLAQQLMVAN
jgi:hypothetical protein